MKKIRVLFILFCALFCLGGQCFAEDCHELTAEWFGADGQDGSVLEIQTVDAPADAVLNVLEAYNQQREQDFSEIQTYADSDDSRTQLIAWLEQRINAVITDAEVTSLITGLKETENGYIATVYEWTFFDYDDLSDGLGGSDTAGFGTEHTMTFQYNANGGLELISDVYEESSVLTGAEEVAASAADSDMEENISLYAAAPNYDADFDPVKAAIYANTWVTKEDLEGGKDPSLYNPAYKNFASSGGDCANYVSQCLYAGGMDRTSSWQPYSYAWINCHGMYGVFNSRGKTLSSFTEADVWPGTILLYSGYSHVTICVGHNSAGTPVINGHTSDRYRVPWNYSKEKLIYIIQLTDFEIQELTFEGDAIVFYQNAVSVPLYTSYRSGKATLAMKGNRGNRVEVLTTFYYEDTLWFAYDVDGTVYYGKMVDGIYLESQVPELCVSAPQTVTTNDYMTITVSLADVSLENGKLTLMDKDGNCVDVPVTAANGGFTGVVDCQDLMPGEITVMVSASGGKWQDLAGCATVTVVEENTVSGREGDGISWTLDKTTGELVIYGSGTVEEAGYSRFAGKIKTVQTSPDILGLTAQQFERGTLTTIYGQPQYLADVAQELDAEFVQMGFFMDVYPNKWHYEAISYAYENGLVKGMETYEFWPEWHMDRAMFVTVLARIAGVDQSQYTECAFTDVAPNRYYYSSIAWAVENGIVKGVTETEFHPGDEVTREQAIVFISRFISLYQLELPDAEDPGESYSDLEDAHNYAQPEIEAMRLKGLAKGYKDGTFLPKNTLTRAEAATLLQRLCLAIGDQELVIPEEPEDPEETEEPAEPVDPEDPEEPEEPAETEDPEAPEASTEPVVDADLQQLLESKLDTLSGTWNLYYKNLDTNEIVAVDEEPMVAASMIKLFIAGAYCQAVEQGEIEDDYRTQLKNMLSVSDNTATNAIITALGMDRINQFIEDFGAANTKLNRKMLASGTENYTTAKDCAMVLEAIYQGTYVSEAVSQELLGYLEAQSRTNKIPAGVPAGTRTANKTGELTGVENDGAIIWSDSDYVLVVLSADWTCNAGTAQKYIAEISELVYDYVNDVAVG